MKSLYPLQYFSIGLGLPAVRELASLRWFVTPENWECFSWIHNWSCIC